jgi:uncharacterized protein YceH (UPF0502 family)
VSDVLTHIETRVLGALVEKQISTPEYYPLTINSLTLACNQKNNRHPVTAYSENEVGQAVETLREKNLVYVFYGSTSRVPKYKHVMPEVLHTNAAETALMCVLMLRGPQTPGELRGNAARLYEFTGLDEVEQTLSGLISHEPDQLVARLPRQTGQKEVRFGHLLSGEIPVEVPAEPARPSARQTLEQKVDALASEVETLRREFDEFKRQFQ